MSSAFGAVVIVVGVIGVLGALAALLTSRSSWESYGRGHLLKDSDAPTARPSSPDAAATAERDDEIRQMLRASNARRRRRGEPERDVETALAQLTRTAAPQVDDELRSEIRELVLARHRRRARRTVMPAAMAPAPADIEAEVQREIARLSAR